MTQEPATAVSKRALKRQAKVTSSDGSTVDKTAEGSTTPHAEASLNGYDESNAYASPHLKELHRSLRNIKKKLTSFARIDAIIKENPGTSLNELLATRKINADQKAQQLKRPALVAQQEELEKNVALYEKVDKDHQEHIKSQKETLDAEHLKHVEQIKAEARAEALSGALETEKEHFMILTKFLRYASEKRQAGHTETPEAKAMEGLLLDIYGLVDLDRAWDAITKLVQGSEEQIADIHPEPFETTYATVKELSISYIPASMAATTPTEASNDKIVVPDSAVDNSSPPQTDSDPTLANAGMTELEDPPLNAMSSINAVVTNGHSADSVITDSPEQGRSGGGAANEAGEAGWGGASAHQQDLSGSYEIIQPRDAQETNNGVTATPAAPTNGNQPWADDPTNMAVPTQSSTSNQKPTNYPRAAAPNTEPPAASSDGFHEVVHRNGRDRGGDSGFRGGYRGSRGRGGGAFRADGGFRGSHSEYRGRGAFRGDYRGDYRGGGGEYRGGGGDYRGGGGERVFRGARDGGRGRGRGEHGGFEG